MDTIKIIIDGVPREVRQDGKSVVSVQHILIAGEKPEGHLENFKLLRITDSGDKKVIYSKNAGIGSLGDLVDVKEGDTFVIEPDDGKHSYTIIVDTQEKDWNKEMISYEEVINLSVSALYIDDNPDISYTIVYYNDSSSEGMSLIKGKTVKVQNRMIFNVTKTDKS